MTLAVHSLICRSPDLKIAGVGVEFQRPIQLRVVDVEIKHEALDQVADRLFDLEEGGCGGGDDEGGAFMR